MTGAAPVSFARPGAHWPLLALVAAYALAVAITGPSGDFALNDDWSYVPSAKTLALAHDWRPSGWTSMPLITQALWAAPFCKLSTCGFEAFRASSLVAGLILLIASYALLWHVTGSRLVAALGAATAAFNPITFQLAFTFMTDTFFAMLLAVTSLAFLKAHRSGSAMLFAAAVLLAIAATLTRQLALCVPSAYLALCVFAPQRSWRRIVGAALAVILCILALMLFERWMRHTGRLPIMYDIKSRELVALLGTPRTLLANIANNTVVVLLYLGLFSLPVLLIRDSPGVGRASLGWIPRAAAIGMTLIAAILMWRKLGMMPVGVNILIPQGLGPLTLRDTYILGLPNVPPLRFAFWSAVTLLSLVGLFRLTECAVSFVLRLAVRAPMPMQVRDAALFAFACTAVYLGLLLPAGFFDRYLAALVPVVILFIVASTTPAQWRALPREAFGAAGCAVLAILAVLATHDYMSWNRARWQAIADAQRIDGASAATMDAGAEFNGAANYAPDFVRKPGTSWWWVKDDTFLVTFGPVDGYTVLRRHPYETWLPPAVRHIHVLKR